MLSKVVFVVALAVSARAGILAPATPVAYATATPVTKLVAAPHDFDPNPQYSFAYDVHDTLTGDDKRQQETRNGDVVQGSYSLVDADGLRRTVDYTADPVHGFNAIVRREPLTAPVVAKVAAPLGLPQPAPFSVTRLAYSTPIAKLAAPLAVAQPGHLLTKLATPISTPIGFSNTFIH